MPATLPELHHATLTVRPWPDPVIDRVGHDPRSTYVERFWLGVLGPSTTWLLRRVATGLEAAPEGFELPLADTARSLGLGGDGRNSPFVRALSRCCQFDVAQPAGDGALHVRRRLPPLTRRQLVRLPEGLQAEHERWVEAEAGVADLERLRTRSRRLALSLLELGEDLEATERQLHRWRFHPSLARESALWAWERHRHARAVVEDHGAETGHPVTESLLARRAEALGARAVAARTAPPDASVVADVVDAPAPPASAAPPSVAPPRPNASGPNVPPAGAPGVGAPGTGAPLPGAPGTGVPRAGAPLPEHPQPDAGGDPTAA